MKKPYREKIEYLIRSVPMCSVSDTSKFLFFLPFYRYNTTDMVVDYSNFAKEKSIFALT